jgi:hypothetical protein
MTSQSKSGLLSLFLIAALGCSSVDAQDPVVGDPAPPPPNPGMDGVSGTQGGPAVGPQAGTQPGSVVGIGTTNKGKPIPEGCWFKKIHLDFGSVVENTKEKDTSEYVFENKTGKDQLIHNFTTSCKCQGVKFFINGSEVKYKRKPTPDQPLVEPIKIPKGAKGKIVMTMDLTGAATERVAEIRVDTTDPNMPSFTLTSEAKILAAFTVDPEIFNLGSMSPMEKKDFVFKVRSNIVKGDKWQITEKNPVLPGGLHLDALERKTDAKGFHYEIRGHYGPGLPQGAMGGDVIFKTSDERHNIMIRVTADVQYRVVVDPRLAVMGAFPNKTAKEVVCHVIPNKVGDQIHVTGLNIFKSSHPKNAYTVKIVPPVKDSTETLKLPGMQNGVPLNSVWKVVITTKPGIKAKTFRIKGRLVFKEVGIAEKVIHIVGFPKNF